MNIPFVTLNFLLASSSFDSSKADEVSNRRQRHIWPTEEATRELRLFDGSSGAAGEKDANGCVKSKKKGAAIRAFSVCDVAGPEIASMLSGEKRMVQSKNDSEASLIFKTMVELAQAGTSGDEMEEAMRARGYETEAVAAVLEDDADHKEKVTKLMNALGQMEIINRLSEIDEDVVMKSKTLDAFGNIAKKERPGKIPGKDWPSNGSPSKSEAKLDKPKPNVRGSLGKVKQFGGPSKGPGSGSVKPKPVDKPVDKPHDRRLIVPPEGCNVRFPNFIGDGYCDMYGNYNTKECNYDGGDCCDFTCVPNLDYDCGYNGYDCKSCPVPEPQWVGDGYCDIGWEPGNIFYNSPECGLDGGDCCLQTCKEGAMAHNCAIARTNDDSNCKCSFKGHEPKVFPRPDVHHAGFRIRNDTPWPLEVSLWQVGPLYWELLNPGDYFFRKTGAVWFTVKATINMDNEPSINNWSAIWPIGVVVIAVVAAFVTMGGSADLTASYFLAASQGSVAADTALAIAGWMTSELGVGYGTALYVTVAIGRAALAAVSGIYGVMGVEEAVLGDLDEAFADDQFSYSKYDVFAGYEYPYRRELQTITVQDGFSVIPAFLQDSNQCITVFDRDNAEILNAKCIAGDCYL